MAVNLECSTEGTSYHMLGWIKHISLNLHETGGRSVLILSAEDISLQCEAVCALVFVITEVAMIIRMTVHGSPITLGL